jgi:hypothetical protein
MFWCLKWVSDFNERLAAQSWYIHLQHQAAGSVTLRLLGICQPIPVRLLLFLKDCGPNMSHPLWIDVFQNPGMGQSLKTDSKLINGKGNDRILWLGRNSLRDLEKHLESFGNGHMVMPQYGSNGWAWPKEVDWIQLSNSLRNRQAATYVGPPNLNMVSENSVAIKIAMARNEKLQLNSPLGVILHIFSHTQMDPKQKKTFNKTCH